MELASIPEVRQIIGVSGKAQDTINLLPKKLALPDFAKDLHVFVDLSTLENRFQHTRIVSHQYICPVLWPDRLPDKSMSTEWVQCSFIECDRDSNGRLWHVLFVTESINEAKIQELENQRDIINGIGCAGASAIIPLPMKK